MISHDHPLARAVLYAIVFFAVTHLALSFFYGMFSGDPDFANMFHVLGFDLFWPALGHGPGNAILGVFLIVAVWAVIAAVFWHVEHKGKKRE